MMLWSLFALSIKWKHFKSYGVELTMVMEESDSLSKKALTSHLGALVLIKSSTSSIAKPTNKPIICNTAPIRAPINAPGGPTTPKAIDKMEWN